MMKPRSRNALIYSFTALVVALIIYGWATHEEPGLMTACPAPACPTAACLVDYSGDCGEIKWDHAPLTVSAPDAAPQDVEILRREANAINYQLGYHALRVVDAPADITVLFDQLPEACDGHDGGTSHSVAAGATTVRSADVRLCNVTIVQDRSLTLAHELGHALGLAHDWLDPSSIMHPWVRPDGILTSYDKGRLHKLYAGG